MKTFITSLLGMFVVFCAFAQEEQEEAVVPGPAITFEELVYDFGDITQGDVVEHIFKFDNTGDAPLIITDVQRTCGCTAPSWPREPVMPGMTKELTVRFNSAGKMGRQIKVITVVSNAVGSKNQVKIVTNVLPKKEEEIK